MKKLLVLALVMAMASAVSAQEVSVWFEVDPTEPTMHEGGYKPSQIITINVIADFDLGSFSLSVASDFGAVVGTGIEVPTGSGHDAGTVNPLLDVFPDAGLVVNSGGILLTGAKGAIWTIEDPLLPAYEIIYSFEFHIPDLPESTLIIIDDVGFVSIKGETVDIDDIESLVIHTPEPLTIALLGLGGLFLRRRK
ncbi:MAG: PEP-CTERM sorting domain-containing protein [Planctomycetota bacterium]